MAMGALAVLLLVGVLGLGQPSALNTYTGWTPPVGYVPMRLQESMKRQQVQPRAPYRPWRQGPCYRHMTTKMTKTREVLGNSTMVAVASVIQDTKLENTLLRQQMCAQRQEIAHLRTHMSALELEAELRDFWRKEFKEVRYVGNDTFVVAYTLKV